ncbi:MAG: flagellar hook-length control protein FliK [Phycisphaerales bacterium]|nr:MAG: flagellar hook-length control protein FliK [Phycisphaerales bacterium]
MDTSALTIDKLFAAPAAMAAPAPKADARKAENAFAAVAEDGTAQVDSPGAEATDNVRTDAAGTRGSKTAREFRQVLREKAASESPPKNQIGRESKEHDPVSDPATPKKAAQTVLAENSVPVLQSRGATVAGVESKAGSKLAQLMAGLKPEKSPPVTGHAAKSAQIKALAATGEKRQLGLKTVLPAKSNGQNGLKAVLPKASAIMPATKAQPGLKARTDKTAQPDGKVLDAKIPSKEGNVKELVPEAPDDAGNKITAANKKLQGVDILAQGDVTKPPVQSAKKDMMPEALADGDDKKMSADGRKASMKSALPSTHAKVVEKPPQPVANDPGKHLPSAEASGKAGIQQTKAKLSDAHGKESAPDGSNAANARSSAKLNATEVQVSDGQPRNRGRSATNHGPTQNFEQILTHSNPQGAITSQPAAAAAGARGANLPAQSLPGDVSADIGRQILESIQGSASQQGAERNIAVRLNPPELGQVFIRIQEQNTELMGVLEVSRTQTRFEIEQALPEIVRNLADCGIHVRRFDVVLSEQGRPEQEAFGGQSMQNNGPYEHDPADQGAWADEPDLSAMNEWSPNNDSYDDFFEPQEALVANDSINMLI